ncbi:MAG TPA: ATPase, T2SS/T4P/T4SS family [Polyangiaceae bacterium]
MFTIIISEKGGAERREAFDKNEINVGRVQGNDLMLPKGNVSKHHARLLFRDGRFIVTDLKSTNGTYVNGRKISQATIVREGDKIYIGDFVLRLETAQAGASADGSYGPPPNDDSQGGRTPARQGPLPREAVGGGPMPPIPGPPVGPPPLPPQVAAQALGGATPMMQQPSPPMPGPVPFAPPQGGAQQQAGRSVADQSVSHYPLERDPDDSESAPELKGAPVPRVPGPPRVPQGGAEPKARPSTVQARGGTATSAQQAPAVRSAVPPPTGKPLPRETPQQAARRLALITLVDRVADVVELAPLKQSPTVTESLSQQIDRAVREQAKSMREEGEAPEGIDLELLARDALRELVGLGSIGPLLEDEETSEIHVSRPDYVLAIKGGNAVLADPSFTSEDALARIVSRLAHQAGEPWHSGELVIERRLARGAQLVAIAPPAAANWVVSIRKRRRIETSLEDLARSGSLSRPMAQLLEGCAAARANVLVVGSGAGAVSSILAAIASAAPAGERVVVMQGDEEIGVPQGQVVPLALVERGVRAEESLRAAARLGADRLVVASLAGQVAAGVLDVIAEGAEGVLAGLGAPSMRHGLARLASQVALARPGSGVDVAREAVADAFDLVVEVVRGADGRLRVLRIAELAEGSARDVFVLSGDGAGEGAYAPTGVVPLVANDLAARGVKVDANAFKRR